METVATPERVVLHNVGWDTYDRHLLTLQDSSAPRLTYDRGTLEILHPTLRHEKRNRRMAALVTALAGTWQVPIDCVGSMTLRRETLDCGIDPDSCFYIQHAAQMATRDDMELDAGDPPPDLALEIVVTPPSIEQLPIYARVGVPEVWRHADSMVTIYVLANAAYEEQSHSRAFPLLRADALTDLVVLSERRGLLEWLKYVREWAGAQTPETDASGTITA